MSVVDLPAVHKLHQKHPLGGQLPVDAGDLEWERAGQEGPGGWGFWARATDRHVGRTSAHMPSRNRREGPEGPRQRRAGKAAGRPRKKGRPLHLPQQGPRPPPGTLLLGDQRISPPRSSASSRHNEEHIPKVGLRGKYMEPLRSKPQLEVKAISLSPGLFQAPHVNINTLPQFQHLYNFNTCTVGVIIIYVND